MSLNEGLNEFIKSAAKDSNFAAMFKSSQWTNGKLIKMLLKDKSYSNFEHINSVKQLLKTMKNDAIAAEKELVPRLSEAINVNRLRKLYVFYHDKYQHYPNMSSEKEISKTMKELYKLNSLERLPEDVYNLVKEFTKKLKTTDENKRQANVNRMFRLIDSVENDIESLEELLDKGCIKIYSPAIPQKPSQKPLKEVVDNIVNDSCEESCEETVDNCCEKSLENVLEEPLQESSQDIVEEPLQESLSELLEESLREHSKHTLYEKCPNILKGWLKYDSLMSINVTVDDSIIETYLNYYFEHPNEKPKNLIEQLETLFQNKDRELPLESLKDFKPIFNIALYTALDNSTSEDFDINILRKEGIPKDIIIELL